MKSGLIVNFGLVFFLTLFSHIISFTRNIQIILLLLFIFFSEPLFIILFLTKLLEFLCFRLPSFSISLFTSRYRFFSFIQHFGIYPFNCIKAFLFPFGNTSLINLSFPLYKFNKFLVLFIFHMFIHMD